MHDFIFKSEKFKQHAAELPANSNLVNHIPLLCSGQISSHVKLKIFIVKLIVIDVKIDKEKR